METSGQIMAHCIISQWTRVRRDLSEERSMSCRQQRLTDQRREITNYSGDAIQRLCAREWAGLIGELGGGQDNRDKGHHPMAGVLQSTVIQQRDKSICRYSTRQCLRLTAA